MFIRKCRIKIYIEPQWLRYQIIYLVNTQTAKQNETTVNYPYQNLSDVEQLILELKNRIPTQSVFELYLNENDFQTKQLKLPPLNLALGEQALYVEASIYQLFELTATNVCYDFIYSADKSYLNVTICKRDYVNEWLDLFKKHNLRLHCIGGVINEEIINFLPWRQEKQKRHKFSLLVTMVCIMGIACCSMGYLWHQTQLKLSHYTLLNVEQQHNEKRLTQQLATFIPKLSVSQQQIYHFLTLLSEQLPPVIWLESFHYQPQQVIISGYSFRYIEIINFNQTLLRQDNIIKSQIHDITRQEHNLSFKMEITFNEE
ncbi:PilN domain-containing protein [Gilliamella sp. CG22]|uniref:PilN domain-containing protein n=1 Tax=Gilliamella sp. CG22 TaxID=3351504 RepID=UPI0039881673